MKFVVWGLGGFWDLEFGRILGIGVWMDFGIWDLGGFWDLGMPGMGKGIQSQTLSGKSTGSGIGGFGIHGKSTGPGWGKGTSRNGKKGKGNVPTPTEPNPGNFPSQKFEEFSAEFFSCFARPQKSN